MKWAAWPIPHTARHPASPNLAAWRPLNKMMSMKITDDQHDEKQTGENRRYICACVRQYGDRAEHVGSSHLDQRRQQFDRRSPSCSGDRALRSDFVRCFRNLPIVAGKKNAGLVATIALAWCLVLCAGLRNQAGAAATQRLVEFMAHLLGFRHGSIGTVHACSFTRC